MHSAKKSKNITNPLVSICCTTYNHSLFVEKALKGFLNQKTSFDYEIIINDDASTDDTVEIIKRYQSDYPEIIKATYQEKNQLSQGVSPMAQLVLPKAKGKYIALCEGDDYWIKPCKLQKQVDFLESNTDCSICYTRARVINKNGKDSGQIIPKKRKIDSFSNFEDQLRGNLIPTLTCVFRSGYIQRLPEFYFKHWCRDWLLHLFNSHNGKIGFIDEITAAYRKHEWGVSNSITQIEKIKNNIETYKSLNLYYDLKYENIIQRMISKQYSLLSKEFALQKEKKKSIYYLLKSIKDKPINKYATLERAKASIALLYPNLFKNYRENENIL